MNDVAARAGGDRQPGDRNRGDVEAARQRGGDEVGFETGDGGRISADQRQGVIVSQCGGVDRGGTAAGGGDGDGGRIRGGDGERAGVGGDDVALQRGDGVIGAARQRQQRAV